MKNISTALTCGCIRRSLCLLLAAWSGFSAGGPARNADHKHSGPFFSASIEPVAQNIQDSTPLEPGKAIEHDLAGGQRHSYQVELLAGQYIGIEIKQQGIEVGVSLKSPNGKAITLYSPFGHAQELSIARVAESSGTYQLEVYAASRAAPGRYQIQIEQLHPATENERELFKAQTLLEEYQELRIQGKYDECRSPLIQAIEIREKVLGPDHLLVATPLNRLGSIYDTVGDYARAEPLLQRAFKIKEKALGPDSPELGYDLQGLGVHYEVKGDYIKAEEAYKKAIDILERAGRTENLIFEAVLGQLGMIYYELGDYENAERCYGRSHAIQEKLLGPDNFHLAPSFTRLGRVAYDSGDYSKAEAMFSRALALFEKAVGPAKVDLTGSLNDLAGLYCSMGNYAKAEGLLNRALTILEQTGSMTSSAARETLFGLGRLYAAQGLLSEAIRFETRASEVQECYVRLNVVAGSEREKLAFLGTLSAYSSRNISLHTQRAPGDQAARDLAVTTILRLKGRVQDAMSASLASLRDRLSVEDRRLLNQLNDVSSRLATLVIRGPEKLSSAEQQERVKSLEEQREALEGEISQHSSGFYERSEPVTLPLIQAAIPAKAALVEYAVYQPFDPKARDATALGEPHYVVYVVPHDGAPQWAELGAAKEVDLKIDAWRSALRNAGSRGAAVLGREVYQKVMKPIRGLLGDATQLLISADGELNLVPFEALVDDQGRYLIQSYSLSYLTSGRDLLRMQVSREAISKPLIVANPAFGEEKTRASSKPGVMPAGRSSKVASAGGTRELSDFYFGPLATTEQEARSIQALFPDARVLSGVRASKSSLKQVAAPRILHVATHGFFLEAGAASGRARPAQAAPRTGNATIENPLLRSGLALAGANLRQQGDDGILTALEASGLNLWGTKLVTLSACDTGLGEVKTGEGVYGLRRAFVEAGAESLVMSLWPVSDYVTREMMTSYYAGLKQGLGRGEALRRVKLAMLKRRGRQHPFFWASFIQSGEWANLDGKR